MKPFQIKDSNNPLAKMPNVFYGERKEGEDNLIANIHDLLERENVQAAVIEGFLNDPEIVQAENDPTRLQRSVINSYWRRKIGARKGVINAMKALSEFTAVSDAVWRLEFQRYVIPVIKQI